MAAGTLRLVRRAVVGLVALTSVACSAGHVAHERSEPSAAVAVTQTARPPTGALTVVATGDVLIHPAVTEQARADGSGMIDFRPVLAGIRPVIAAADLAICHLETPLAPPAGPFSGYPSFSAPPQIARALADTGYDTCSTASNHTLDRGASGVTRTLNTLDSVGLRHTGSARSATEQRHPLIVDVHGVPVAQLSYTYGFNGIPRPAGMPWLANQIDVGQILAAARAARSMGAEIVIASLHWGQEYQAAPTASQRDLARRLLTDGAIDLIVGHHAHVVQPFGVVAGRWVAYGLGNSVARHAEPRGTTEEGVIGRFTFVRDIAGRWVVQRAEYIPTLVDLGPPLRVRDLTAMPADPRTVTALRRIDATVHALGVTGLTRPR